MKVFNLQCGVTYPKTVRFGALDIFVQCFLLIFLFLLSKSLCDSCVLAVLSHLQCDAWP